MSLAGDLIRAYYGERRARRSGVKLMQHIEEGLVLLDALGASEAAKDAFCVHPIVQADADGLRGQPLDPRVVTLALEYRTIAGEALSTRAIARPEDIRLSTMPEVNLMLVADKVQNRKDFEKHHATTHPRADALARYFRLWLARLGIDEARYHELVALLS
jgi:hypothetical protein